ncbi:hypothetical protein MHC_04465 [Mycoplasma haemocanis str. Illinois]|uniref:Uncharacterized protein n=1 Tax=Mycoplasma haemocanis (strain Illinois) TaxID=1111676 RepID=H6N7X7_MYCHN|nr:hypothetical protein [Mycoplasma haemocanis]AEW45749.1 hypothetical protein MHC_04465 [Mycoplasma haemocanis str. Illinois]
MITIQDYKLTIEPFLYQFKIKGRYEINSSTPLATKSIFANYRFPNQLIKKLYLTKSKDSCKHIINEKLFCQVYENTGYLNLASDSYFKREIKNYETIPIEITFDLDTTNFNPNPSLIDETNLISISTYFKHKNSFYIEGDNNINKRVKVPTYQIIDNGNHYQSYEHIDLSISRNISKFSEGLISIKRKDNLLVNNASLNINNNNIPITQKKSNEWIHIFPRNFEDLRKSDSFKASLFLLFKNQGYTFDISGNYSLEERLNHYRIQPIFKPLPKNLNEFKSISF